MTENSYYTYILSNFKRTTLYIGITSNLTKRLYQHSQGQGSSFTKKYKLKYLMYYEVFENVNDAIYREKFLKGKRRQYKIELIKSLNPCFLDLSANVNNY